MHRIAPTLAMSLAITSVAAQQFTVVPAIRTNSEATAFGWIPGASRGLRQQTLIGSSHLTSLIGKTITAIQLRRNNENEAFQGGQASIAARLTTSPLAPLECSSNFEANAGVPGVPGASLIPSSVTVTLHPSPVPSGSIGWTQNNRVDIPLMTPFTYQGGTLCVDLVGTPITGQNTNWWMADLELEDISGTTIDLGGGCGTYGNQWSQVDHRTLLPGANARFTANGTPNGPALAAFGSANTFGIPLSSIGLPSGPGCDIWLSTITTMISATFEVSQHPLSGSLSGTAAVQFKVPNTPAVFGFTMATQWVDLAQLATSNAVEWTIATAAPTLEMAIIDGDPTETTGYASVYMGYVFRFEHN